MLLVGANVQSLGQLFARAAHLVDRDAIFVTFSGEQAPASLMFDAAPEHEATLALGQRLNSNNSPVGSLDPSTSA